MSAPEQQAASVQPPAGLRQRIAEAIRDAAHDCPGDCGLSERECDAQHPIQVSAWHYDQVASVYGDIDALAEVAAAVVEPEMAALRAEVATLTAVARSNREAYKGAVLDCQQADTELAALRQQLADAQAETARLTTALEVATSQHAKAITARDKAKQRAKISDDIQRAEKQLFDTAIRDLGGSPVDVQNLYAQLQSRTRQWKAVQQQAEQLRQQLNALGPATWRARWESTVVEARRQAARADRTEQLFAEAHAAAYHQGEPRDGLLWHCGRDHCPAAAPTT
ncbi:hypothetical protein ACWEO1_22720 [Kitasatospora cineracea]